MTDTIEVPPDEEIVEADALIRLSELADRRVEAARKLIQAAIKMTNPSDWVNISGVPYLACSGAEKIARVFGIGWKDMKMIEEAREDERGKWVLFTCEGTFFMSDIAIRSIGTCSTRAKFFGVKEKKLKALAEVDIPSVKKAAYTNCIVNGITRLIGLRKMTWEDLRVAKLNIGKIPKVEFKTPPTKKPPNTQHKGVQTPLKKVEDETK